jgi:hypothetical protein
LGEICDVKFHDAIECDGEQVELLEVRNTKDRNFFVDIRKFLPERCIPEFKLSREDFSVTNAMLWSTVVFWISDGSSCERDVFRFSNMRVNVAETYYGEDVVNNLFSLSQTMTREQSITPSIKTLSDFIEFGDTWWAPIPDNRFKGRDGRDLNLEVICAMMVSNNIC